MAGTVIAAPDKFRGTATAPQIASAIGQAATDLGWSTRLMPLADGGEGTLDVFGGPNRTTTVTGPLGPPVDAGWRLDGKRAVIEMATASGLLLAGGPAGNDPLHATTKGTGELIAAAIAAGATEIVVGVGGSATTDGGAGALEVLAPDPAATGLPEGVRVMVCADVRTRFTDAARVFGPQKGADSPAIATLTTRLERLREQYRRRFGRDVEEIDGSGAAGGLAGALAAWGAVVVPGFDTLASVAGLDDALAAADPATDVVVTGEGRFDATSMAGKVVGGVISRSRRRALRVLVVAGAADGGATGRADLPDGVLVLSLVELFGQDAAWHDTVECVGGAVSRYLRERS